MDSATIATIILVLVALAAGLVVFGVLRERGRGTLTAGCASVVVGLMVVACFVAYQTITILT